jgi:hypothetical protein
MGLVFGFDVIELRFVHESSVAMNKSTAMSAFFPRLARIFIRSARRHADRTWIRGHAVPNQISGLYAPVLSINVRRTQHGGVNRSATEQIVSDGAATRCDDL